MLFFSGQAMWENMGKVYRLCQLFFSASLLNLVVRSTSDLSALVKIQAHLKGQEEQFTALRATELATHKLTAPQMKTWIPTLDFATVIKLGQGLHCSLKP